MRRDRLAEKYLFGTGGAPDKMRPLFPRDVRCAYTLPFSATMPRRKTEAEMPPIEVLPELRFVRTPKNGYWRRRRNQQAELQPLAERYWRACARSGLSLNDAVTMLRMVESNDAAEPWGTRADRKRYGIATDAELAKLAKHEERARAKGRR